MKKIALAFLSLIMMAPALGAPKTYADAEQKYIFTAENLATTIPDFITDDKHQTAMAQKYIALMNPGTGAVSIADLFAICRAGGLNTYRASGFETCRNFVVALLNNTGNEVDDGALGGFCPGLDANGKNPNKLASITDKTRVGDVCTSSHIAMGEVVFQRDNSYSCTCMALACNGNYDLRGGACNTPIPVGTPTCPNTKHKETSENNTTAKCLEFCKAKANRENCALSGVVMRHSTKECICSANADEIDAARKSMQQAANRISNLPYYSVCFKDKGKTGGTERCVEKVFNWVNVGQLQAAGIAQEYARVHYGDTITCKSGYDTHWNDDYIQCTSTKAGSKIYYEFQFDDVVESIDNDILADTVHSICKIHGLDDNVPHNVIKMTMGIGGIAVRAAVNTNIYGCKTTSNVCSSKVSASAQKFGYSTEYAKGMCFVKERRVDRESADDNLARISGVDPYVFFHGPQIQGGQTIVDKLRTVVLNAGHKVNSFRCDSSTGKINKANGVIGFVTGNTDDILRCYLNGNTPVDFVFEDFSESWLYKREEGEAAIQCIVSGGKFAGQKCHGLDKQQCIDAGKRLQAEFPGSSGTWWNGTDCVLVDASEAKMYDTGINIGLGAVGAVDCVFGTKVGCVLFAVETAGLATEIVSSELINSRVNEFLSVGTRCKSRDCALSAIRDLGAKVMTVQGALGVAEMHAVDQTLAELIEYLEPEDLGALTGTEDWSQIIEQLGGDTNDLAGNIMVFAQYAGLIAQFASLGASGLRVTGRAIAKVAGKESKIGRAGIKMANFLETSKRAANAADAVADAGRAASHADEASNATRAATHLEDVGDAARSADAATGVRGAGNADNAANAARGGNVTSDAGRVANRAEDAAQSSVPGAHATDAGVHSAPVTEDVVQYSKLARETKITDGITVSDVYGELNIVGPYEREIVSTLQRDSMLGLKLTDNTVGSIEDAYLFDLGKEYAAKASKATSPAEELTVRQAYHSKMLDYLATKFDVAKTHSVATSRRQMYLEAIADDADLSNKAKIWGQLSDTDRKAFMQKLVNKIDNGYCRGDNCTVGIMRGHGNTADNVESIINIDFSQRIAYRSNGTRMTINPEKNLDDAMLVLSHEHGHNITRYAPQHSSIPEEYLGWAIAHLEGNWSEAITGSMNMNDYLRGIYEKEGFMIGEIVGNDFTKDLQRMIGR